MVAEVWNEQSTSCEASRESRRSWWRPVVLVLGGVAGVGIAVVVGASIASASPHTKSVAATSASPGYTLCATKSGALTYAKSGKCPKHTTTLSAGESSQVASLTAQVKTLKTQVAGLQSQVSTLQSNHTSDSSAISTLQGQVSSLSSNESTDASNISGLKTLLTGFSRATDPNGYETLTVSGENIQLINGSGSETTNDGLGNLIVGYNDNGFFPYSRTGSHNLIVGDDNGYSSYGGFIAGISDKGTAAYASVLGGSFNVASGIGSSVSGGDSNTASGLYSSVSGGTTNIASGGEASVSGGDSNTVSGDQGAILGGYEGTVTSNYCSSVPPNANTSVSC